jgi:hypothetical protein
VVQLNLFSSWNIYRTALVVTVYLELREHMVQQNCYLPRIDIRQLGYPNLPGKDIEQLFQPNLFFLPGIVREPLIQPN